MQSLPIKYHGGKSYLAQKIINLIPDHIHYVEPFFGGGAVLFNKPESLIDNHSEVINDLYGDLINFWTVLADDKLFKQFHQKISVIPFSKPIWQNAILSNTTDLVDRAVNFFIRYRQSRQGLGNNFSTLSKNRTRRGMNEQVASWLSAIDGLNQAHKRLQRVVIFQEPAVNVIKREDGPNTFFYCDPPYIQSTRISKAAYKVEMTNDQHEELLNVLGGLAGKFILSGYENDLYNDYSNKFNWSRVDIQIDNKSSSKKIKPIKTECLWKNF